MDFQIIGIDRTVELLARNGLKLEPQQVQTLSSYASLLQDWNAKVNLISRKDQDNLWGGHILHSLAVLLRLGLPAGLSMLDLGTGGGLPGLPLAIARPDIHFTLLDSIRKKTAALEDIVARLPVSNIQVVNARAEEFPRTASSTSQFHIIISRAVAPLADLLKWSRGLFEKRERRAVELIGVPGRTVVQTPFVAALKGGDLSDEIRAARLKQPAIDILDIPLNFAGSAEAGLEGKRLLIVPV